MRYLARYGGDEWTAIYLDRWESLYEAASKHDAQLVIVGLPIMKVRALTPNFNR